MEDGKGNCEGKWGLDRREGGAGGRGVDKRAETIFDSPKIHKRGSQAEGRGEAP